MKKIFFLYFLLIHSINYAQDCPNRIGSLVINSTTFRDFSNICLSCNIYGLPTIENQEDYLLYKVPQSELNEELIDESTAYEVKPDFENIKSSYNMEVASLNDSIKVIFIPVFLTNGVYIKNLLLKFKDDNLFYMSASLSKEYKDIILEKYKGKARRSEEKTTPNTCKDLKFKKYKNNFSQYFFASDENKIRALLTFDLKISKHCEVEINDKIEIFDFVIYISESDKIIPNMEKLQKEKDDKIKLDKEERLKKF